jgi:D-amino peptidase
MRVLISVDMEGVAGVVDRGEIAPGSPEWAIAREWMTDEASAAIRGVFAFDPDADVLVCDAHARYRNILPQRLDRRARLVRGTPRPNDMLTGIDRGLDAVCLIGYHGRAGTANSVLAHTISGKVIASVRVNGTTVGEIGLSAALAGHFGAIPVLVSGDDTVAAEAEEAAPGITSVIVKWALGSHAAENLHPAIACDRIEEATSSALSARDSVEVPTFAGLVDLEVDLRRPEMTERAMLVPGMELRAPCTIGFTGLEFPVAYGLIGLIADIAGIE